MFLLETKVKKTQFSPKIYTFFVLHDPKLDFKDFPELKKHCMNH